MFLSYNNQQKALVVVIYCSKKYVIVQEMWILVLFIRQYTVPKQSLAIVAFV